MPEIYISGESVLPIYSPRKEKEHDYESFLSGISAAISGIRKSDVQLAPFTTFKIGGPADLFAEARTIEDLIAFVTSARTLEIPVTFLGGGTNILISDKGIRGLVIRNLTQKYQSLG